MEKEILEKSIEKALAEKAAIAEKKKSIKIELEKLDAAEMEINAELEWLRNAPIRKVNKPIDKNNATLALSYDRSAELIDKIIYVLKAQNRAMTSKEIVDCIMHEEPAWKKNFDKYSRSIAVTISNHNKEGKRLKTVGKNGKEKLIMYR